MNDKNFNQIPGQIREIASKLKEISFQLTYETGFDMAKFDSRLADAKRATQEFIDSCSPKDNEKKPAYSVAAMIGAIDFCASKELGTELMAGVNVPEDVSSNRATLPHEMMWCTMKVAFLTTSEIAIYASKGCKRKDAEIAKLKDQLRTADTRLVGYRQELHVMDSRIAAFKTDAEWLRGRLAEMEKVIYDKTGRINSMDTLLREKNDQIRNMEKVLAEKHDQNIGLQRGISDQEQLIGRLNKAPDELAATQVVVVKSLRKELEFAVKDNADLRAKLRAADEQVATLKGAILLLGKIGG